MPVGPLVDVPPFGLGAAACRSDTEGTVCGVVGEDPEPGYAPVGPPVEVPPFGLGAAAASSDVKAGRGWTGAGFAPEGLLPVEPPETAGEDDGEGALAELGAGVCADSGE